MDLCDRLGIETPVVQAPLGNMSLTELAGAVSRAGGLGTIAAHTDAAMLRRELQSCREAVDGRPFAANLLLPFLRRDQVEVCLSERVPVVSLFFGFNPELVNELHGAGTLVLHQVGSVEQAQRALHDGADGLVAQGNGAGGHVLAEEPLAALVPKLVDLARDKPVLASGGIYDRASAERARQLGAAGVWAGTRFLLTHESHAHPEYKKRLLAADTTLETLLFGMGWPALHRVIPNRATERWCRKDPLGPGWVRATNRATEALLRKVPPALGERAVPLSVLASPFYSPIAATRETDARYLDTMPLYAGECVTRIHTLLAAADVVRELSTA